MATRSDLDLESTAHATIRIDVANGKRVFFPQSAAPPSGPMSRSTMLICDLKHADGGYGNKTRAQVTSRIANTFYSTLYGHAIVMRNDGATLVRSDAENDESDPKEDYFGMCIDNAASQGLIRVHRTCSW